MRELHHYIEPFEPSAQEIRFSCCFTGHRDFEPTADNLIALRTAVEELASRGVRLFYEGGAEGFDYHAARTVQQLKAVWPHLRVICVEPFVRHCRHRDAADEIIYVSPRYTDNSVFHIRNRFMVDRAAYVIAYAIRHGGTFETLKYAHSLGRNIRNTACHRPFSTAVDGLYLEPSKRETSY